MEVIVNVRILEEATVTDSKIIHSALWSNRMSLVMEVAEEENTTLQNVDGMGWIVFSSISKCTSSIQGAPLDFLHSLGMGGVMRTNTTQKHVDTMGVTALSTMQNIPTVIPISPTMLEMEIANQIITLRNVDGMAVTVSFLSTLFVTPEILYG